MADEGFILRYDGPALEDHRIEVGDLAEALLGLNEFIQEGNRIVNGGQSPISLKVKATDPGCFQVEIFLAQTLVERAASLFSGTDSTALANLLTILLGVTTVGGAAVGGAISLIRALGGRNPQHMRVKEAEGSLLIELPNGDVIEANAHEWEVVINPKVRKALYRVVRPLEKEGVNSLTIASGLRRESLTVVTTADASSFVPPTPVEEQLAMPPDRETFVHPVNVWFRGDNKWRFSEGEGTFTATMKDTDFLDKVLRDEVSFRTSDVLKVRLRQFQYCVGDDLKSEYEVIKVLEHRRGPWQPPLSLTGEQGADVGSLEQEMST